MLSSAKEKQPDLDVIDTPNDLADDYNNEEIQRLTGFAQTPNVADVESIRERVKSRLSDTVAAVEKSINSANLLLLEKSLNSSYSLFLTAEEKDFSPKPLIPTSNAPSNKIMEKQPRFFSTKRKREKVRNVRFRKTIYRGKRRYHG